MATLKIGADTRELRKSFLEISKELSTKLSKKIEIFDPETKKLFAGEMSRHILDAEGNLKKLHTQASKYAGELKKAAKHSEEELRARKNLLRTLRDIKRESRDLAQLRTTGGDPRSGMGGMLPGLRGLGRMGGMEMAGMAGFGIAGLVGGLAIMRGRRALGAFAGSAEGRMRLGGRGVRDVSGANEELTGLGFGPEQVRGAQTQAVDIFGRGRAGMEQITDTARFARAFGLDPQEIQGQMLGMRGRLGREGAGQTFDLLKKHAQLVGEAMDDAVGPYLQTAADMLTQIQQGGLVLSDEVMNVFTALTREGGEPIERVARQIMGAQAAVQMSTGEMNAFLQRAFAEQGIGQGRIGMTQAAIQAGGLFGVGEGGAAGLGIEDQKRYQRLGVLGPKTGFQNRMEGIQNLIQRMFPQTDIGLATRDRFLQQLFRTQNPLEAAGVYNRLVTATEKGDKGEIKKLKDELKDLQKGPQETMEDHLRNIMDSAAGQLTALNSIQAVQDELVGQKLTPAMLEARDALLSIERVIMGLIGILPGSLTPAERAQGAAKGNVALSEGDVKALARTNPEFAKSMLPQLRQTREQLGARISGLEGTTGALESPTLMLLKIQLENLIKSINNVAEINERGFKESTRKRPSGQMPIGTGATR